MKISKSFDELSYVVTVPFVDNNGKHRNKVVFRGVSVVDCEQYIFAQTMMKGGAF